MRTIGTHGERLSAAGSAVVARNVRTLRRRKGWTMQRLADQLGIVQSGVCRRETGEFRWRTGDLPVLAALFGIREGELTVSCANCGGTPPEGFACLSCGAGGDGS